MFVLLKSLTATKGFSMALREGLDAEAYSIEDQREFLEIIRRECDRARQSCHSLGLRNPKVYGAGEDLCVARKLMRDVPGGDLTLEVGPAFTLRARGRPV